LTKEFALKKSTISDSIKVLLKKGFVKKIDNPYDSRSFYIELTSKGHSILKEKQNIDSYILEILNLFSEEEKEIIHKFFFHSY
jgi:DNA-binding MarR family transcriptional regulator